MRRHAQSAFSLATLIAATTLIIVAPRPRSPITTVAAGTAADTAGWTGQSSNWTATTVQPSGSLQEPRGDGSGFSSLPQSRRMPVAPVATASAHGTGLGLGAVAGRARSLIADEVDNPALVEPAPGGEADDANPASELLLQTPPLPVPDLPNPFDAFDRLTPRALAADLLEALLTTLGEALLGALRGVIDWALGLEEGSLNFVTRTPAAGTTDSTTVRALWDFSRALANAALALVVMWGGFGVMVKHATRTPYHDAMELLPRVVLGALAANLTLVFAELLIDANNAVAAGIGEVTLPGYDQATPTQDGLALVITALVYGVVALLLVLQMLMRLALLDLLIVLSPLAVLAWVLPQTQGWFRWWTGLFPTTVFQQVIQLMALRLGAALMVELTPGSTANALLTLVLGIAVCWLTLKVPALLRGGAHRAGLTAVVSTVLVSRIAGAVMTGGAGAGAAGGRAATGAAGGGASGTAAGAVAARRPTP